MNKVIQDDLTNSFVDIRVRVLFPIIEEISKQKVKAREVGWGSGKSKHKGWKSLARDESVVFKRQYPDLDVNGKPKAEGDLRYRSAWAQIANLDKALREAAKTDIKDNAQYHPCLTIITHFTKELYNHFSVYKIQSNIEYRQRVKERKKPENRVLIDLTQHLTRAYQVLTDISKGKDMPYADVSCAVALTTGRRMSEVHLSAEFQKLDEYLLSFTGQLKGKARKVSSEDSKKVLLIDAVFQIPTLVKADLILAGMRYLEDAGRRIDKGEETKRVNDRYSKPLSQTVKQYWDFMGDGKTTYHKFRGAYFMANVALFNKDVTEFEDYATEIMGDDDMTTLASYMIYTLSENSLKRI